MDFMTIKQEISTFERSFKENAEQPIDVELTLPDYCPKIEKILKCTLKPRINNLSLGSSSVTAEGDAVICVLYSSSEVKGICGYEMTSEYSKDIDVGSDSEQDDFSANAVCEYINCRAVNERKLDIHGAFKIVIGGTKKVEKDIITNAQNKDLQLQKRKISNIEQAACSSKQFLADDELILPQTSGSIESIIRSSTDVILDECKVVAGKSVIKGNVAVNVLYRSSNGNCESFSSAIPFEEVIDLSGADEDCQSLMQPFVCTSKIKPNTDSNGESRSVIVSAKINVDVIAYKTVDYEVVSDCFCIKNDVKCERMPLKLKTDMNKISAAHQIRETLEFPENSLCDVVDVDCETGELSCRFDDGVMSVNGTLLASVIAADSNGVISCYDKKLPFVHEFTLNGFNCVETDIKASVTDCSYSIKSQSTLELRVQIELCGFVFNCENINVITEVEAVEGGEKVTDDMPALLLYFAQKGESVWNIAMHYNTSPELIITSNSLDGDILPEKKMLIIPSM